MALARRICGSLRGQGGFSLAEVLMAGLVLALAVFPMVGMFDGAYLVSRTAYNINTSSDCIRYYIEKVRNIPFYEAHTQGDVSVPLDVDDFYWGTRSPVNNNAWSTAPYVLAKDFGIEPYPEMQVHVKMSFIDDEKVQGVTLEQAAEATLLSSSWQPRALYGYDRPKTDTGKALTLMIYEVRVTTRDGRSFANAELYANPTDVVANVYVDRFIVTDSDANKRGTRNNALNECISAPHNQAGIAVRAYGEGFSQADVDAGLVSLKLVNVKDKDIDVNGLSFGTDAQGDYLQGTITLNSGGAVSTWAPRRIPGYWHAWLVVNHVISVRNNAFVVEYPVPRYYSPGSDFYDSSPGDGPKFGKESTANELITFTNLGYVTDLEPAVGQNPGVGAVVQLVHTNPAVAQTMEGMITGTNLQVNPAVNKGYQENGLTVTVSFDFRGKVGGNYKVRIINCINRGTASTEVMGNTFVELSNGPFYYLDGPPAVYEAYVYEETPVTADRRHFGYDDRPYTYTLEVKGYNFDSLISVGDVKLGLGGNPSSDPPSGDNEIAPISVSWLDDETIRAVFDFAPEVEQGERGQYWLYVRNSNGFGSVLNPAFDIREPRPIIYGYAVTSYGLWQNYYGVGLRMVGECFDAQGGGYVDVMIKQKDVPGNDWLATQAMGDPVVADAGRLLNCKVNLVDCDLGQWELYVKSQPAGLSDSGYTDLISGVVYRTYVDVSLGAPTLLTAAVPASGEPWSVSVSSRYRNWNQGAGDWKQWQSWTNPVTEGSGVPAWVYENDEDQTSPKTNSCTQGEMYFVMLRGMGFNKGTISINAVNDFGENTAGMDATWNGVTVLQDRAAPQVWIAMTQADAKKTGPHITADNQLNPIRLRIKNDAGGAWSPWFTGRIRVQIGSQY